MSRSFARGPAVTCALALAALQLCGRAQADAYPTRPVTIIVSLALYVIGFFVVRRFGRIDV